MCSNPAGNEADLFYNGDYHTYQFCNGSNWIPTGQSSPHFAQSGYFVLTKSTFTGNLEGLSGADSICLTELATTSTGWNGYATAAADGQLVAGNVHAFLCDDAASCTDPLSGVPYYFANAANSSAGGASFTVDTSGGGPDDSANWSGSSYFGGSYTYWTGGWSEFSYGTSWDPIVWTTGNDCGDWTDSLSSDDGFVGESPYTDATRYGGYSGPNPSNACNSALPLICFVNPLPQASAAGCTNPVGKEADLFYNGTYHTYQFCNGAAWIAWSSGGPTGGSGCSNPAGKEADLIYNAGHHTLQFCNGTAWMSVAGGVYVETAGNGYLVMSKSTWSGNLGDLSGADAKCLTELTTNTGWQGYTAANAGGLLVSGNVHAFLCDDSTCNNLQANATYYFANAANSSLGGASLGTNSSGEGYDLTDWTAPAYFGGDYKYWVGVRSQGSASYQEWGTTPQTTGGSCTNWGSSSSSNSGGVGGTNLFVWEGGTQAWADLVGTACNNTEHLICYVNP